MTARARGSTSRSRARWPMRSMSLSLRAAASANSSTLADGVLQGRADAVLAASIFHFGEFTGSEAKQYMAERGIEMRL